MPVLATLATINFLSGSRPDEVSFLNPAALRERCKDQIKDEDTLEKVIKLTEELQQLMSQYQDSAAATIDKYRAESVKWESSANGLIEQLSPLDSARSQTLKEIVRVRQAMQELLTAEQWQRVFL
ncbi:hypothetical protein [Kaarinaea lacus]